MILPSKGISADNALVTVGASILALLDAPATVTGLWDRFRQGYDDDETPVTFDWFALGVSMLYSIGTIDWNSRGQLEKRHVSA